MHVYLSVHFFIQNNNYYKVLWISQRNLIYNLYSYVFVFKHNFIVRPVITSRLQMIVRLFYTKVRIHDVLKQYMSIIYLPMTQVKNRSTIYTLFINKTIKVRMQSNHDHLQKTSGVICRPFGIYIYIYLSLQN